MIALNEIKSQRIIIAPLCWGLGHATRCIPIINSLLENYNTVAIASDGEALELLKVEFSELEFFELPSYDIRYEHKSMLLNMIKQSPQILKAIAKENKRAQELARDWKADILISDNRLGFYSSSTTSIYITHQITIPAKSKLTEITASRLHQLAISKYNQCWVPDYRGVKSLAGKLSQTEISTPTHYLGPMSRLEKKDAELKYDLTAVLSGPEPQRTALEHKLFTIFSECTDKRCCIVRGTNKTQDAITKYPNIHVEDLLETKALNAIINASKRIVCRAGYTSIMDLVHLEKGAILIPTPGQYEQEYLAKRLNGKYGFISIKQDANLYERIRHAVQCE